VRHESKNASNVYRVLARIVMPKLNLRPLFVFGCLAFASFAGCSDATWYLDPGFAERKAEKDNRPLVYYFKSFDSTLHRNMYWKVLKSGSVKSELRDTINVELEFGFFDDREKRYGVKKAQTCVFVAPDGSKVGDALSVNPVPTPQEFLAWLRAEKAKWNDLQPTNKQPANDEPGSDATGG